MHSRWTCDVSVTPLLQVLARVDHHSILSISRVKVNNTALTAPLREAQEHRRRGPMHMNRYIKVQQHWFDSVVVCENECIIPYFSVFWVDFFHLFNRKTSFEKPFFIIHLWQQVACLMPFLIYCDTVNRRFTFSIYTSCAVVQCILEHTLLRVLADMHPSCNLKKCNVKKMYQLGQR